MIRSPVESTQTHGNLKYFGDHRCLSQSEDCKCMWMYLIFPPTRTLPRFLSCKSLVAPLKAPTWRHLYCMFTYIYSLLIEKGICVRQNISSFHVFLFVCTFVWRSLQFLVSFPFPFLFIEFSVIIFFPCSIKVYIL